METEIIRENESEKLAKYTDQDKIFCVQHTAKHKGYTSSITTIIETEADEIREVYVIDYGKYITLTFNSFAWKITFKASKYSELKKIADRIVETIQIAKQERKKREEEKVQVESV